MNNRISLLLVGAVFILLAGCKLTPTSTLSEIDSTGPSSATSSTSRVNVDAPTSTPSTQTTTTSSTTSPTTRKVKEWQNNCRLIVNGKDITSENYVHLVEEYQEVEIPVTAVMKELGAEVEWKGKKVTITHNGYQRVIDTTQQAFGMPRPPCSAYCCRKMIDGEVVIDSVSAGGMIRWMGAQISINVDEKIIEIE